ncbi:MAG: ribonuclease toxin HepT-like protein [Candidatus Brocadiales bacterium]
MGDLSRQILAEKENVEIALNNLKEAMARTKKSVVELSAIATFLHNIYNGIENILKQVLNTKDINIPKSETWHKDLLNLSRFHGIISEGLSDKLYEYLTFRHFFIHAYGFMLDEGHLEDLANNIPEVWSQFLSEIKNFLYR